MRVFFLPLLLYISVLGDVIIGGKFTVTKAEVEKAVKSLKQYNLSYEDMRKRIIEIRKLCVLLAKVGIFEIPKDLKAKIRSGELSRYEVEELLLDSIINDLRESIIVTDDEIEARKLEYQNRNVDLFRLREIFIKIDDSEELAFQKIKRVFSEIQKNGVDKVPELVNNFSQRLSRYNGGLIGNVRLEALEPAISDSIIQALNSNNVFTEIVREKDGYSIIIVEGVIPQGVVPDNDFIRQEIANEKLNARLSMFKMQSLVSVEDAKD